MHLECYEILCEITLSLNPEMITGIAAKLHIWEKESLKNNISQDIIPHTRNKDRKITRVMHMIDKKNLRQIKRLVEGSKQKKFII